MAGKKYTQISVTEQDIAKAFENNSAKCVVAQALARTIPEASRIEVDAQTVRYTGGDGKRHVFLTPYAVVGYVIGFDAGDEIEPFTFRLWHEREVLQKRQVRTKAGSARRVAGDRVRKQRKARSEAEAKAALPGLSPEERRVAEAAAALRAEKAIAAERTLERVHEETAGQQGSVMTDGDRSVPRRIRAYKTNVRHYGHRVMRQNQVPEGAD